MNSPAVVRRPFAAFHEQRSGIESIANSSFEQRAGRGETYAAKLCCCSVSGGPAVM